MNKKTTLVITEKELSLYKKGFHANNQILTFYPNGKFEIKYSTLPRNTLRNVRNSYGNDEKQIVLSEEKKILSVSIHLNKKAKENGLEIENFSKLITTTEIANFLRENPECFKNFKCVLALDTENHPIYERNSGGDIVLMGSCSLKYFRMDESELNDETKPFDLCQYIL